MMTNQKILEAIKACEKIIRENWPDDETSAAICDHETILNAAPLGGAARAAAQHALYMLAILPQLVLEGRREKAMRWLGFVQGVLWAHGCASIDELKRINMPDGGDNEARP